MGESSEGGNDDGRLQRVLESISDGLIVIAGDGTISYVNAASRQMLAAQDVDADGLIGTDYRESFAGVGGDIGDDLVRKAMDDRDPAEFEFFHADWQVWYFVRIFPVREGGVSIYYHDITARKAAENAVRDSEIRLQRVLNSISDGFLTLDTNWRLTMVNAAARALWHANGIDPDRALGRTLQEVVPELAGSEWEAQARKSMVLRVPTRFEFLFPPWRMWFSCRCYPIAGDGISLYFHDITERKRLDGVLRENERRLQRLIESVADTFQVVGRDWTYKYANESARMLTMLEGKAVAAEPGRNLWDVYPELRGSPGEGALHRAMYERIPGQFEHVHDGHVYLSRAAPIEGDGVSLYTQDITERKAMEDALRDSETRWRTLTDAMPQIVWIGAAESGDCLYVNDQCVRFTGAPAEAFMGNGWAHFIHPEDRDAATREWTRAIEQADDFDVEFRMRRFDGHFRWFKVRGVPMRGSDGSVKMWYGTCTDIQDTMEARFRAEAADRAKSEFLANMSHEIRTPLNAIVGLTSIMLRFESEPAAHRAYLETMQDSATSLTELIGDVLEYARIDADMVELEESDFDLPALMGEVLRMSSVKAFQKEIKVALHCDVAPGTQFVGDCARIRQILLNLMSNAVKFTEAGRVELFVSAQPKADGRFEIAMTVKDSGIGIAADKLDHIFEKFAQADSSITRRFGGTGLGLAISKRLAETMGGRITVESRPGDGSAFTLSIPLPVAEKHPAPSPSPPLDTGPKDIRVLLVEDNPTNAMVTGAMLTKLGYGFTTVPDGRLAIESCRSGAFGVILMDLQMPEMDGMQAARRIRQMERMAGTEPVRVVAMTAYAMAEDRERCLAAGMDDYISKPFSIADLMEKLSV